MSSILELNGLSVDIQKQLSYRSLLGISLKRSLSHFDKKMLIDELLCMTDWLNEQDILDEVALDYRIKSSDSILKKYDKYYPNHPTERTFNDILGFRSLCSSYGEIMGLPGEMFRFADMTRGKAIDDGYRGIHVYFQIDHNHYPIEIQFNSFYDRQLNDWLHDYLYKKGYPDQIGGIMRNLYEQGRIRSENEFKEELHNVLSDC